MRAAHIAQIETPKGYLLNGLWFGILRPRTVYIWIHGLGSSAFSKLDVAELLAKEGAAVLTFSNRGHDKISSLAHKSGKGKRRWAGGGAEVFAECVDDIEGAIRFARRSGAKNIFLVGHSTGCQKSAYWAAKKGKGVKGVVLLAPISDYSFVEKEHGARYRAALALARAYVKKGKKDQLLPQDVWPALDTAQRFLSLYTPESVEEIFTYSQLKKDPTTLRKVRIPTFAILAEMDEYGDRPAMEIAAWFREHLKKKDGVAVVLKANHGFKGAEKDVARRIRAFAKKHSR